LFISKTFSKSTQGPGSSNSLSSTKWKVQSKFDYSWRECKFVATICLAQICQIVFAF